MSEWIGWNGGKCPVHPNTVVVVQYDEREYGKAGDFEWVWGLPENLRIIAYRVIKEYRETREFWLFAGKSYTHHSAAVERAVNEGFFPDDVIHVREVLDENS